ncbi:MAG: universal stress protein [Halodesulfurarchaeum sp.]
MAIDIAISLARQNDAMVELIHVEDVTTSPDNRIGERVLSKGMERTRGFEAVTRTLLESESVSQEIVDYSDDYDSTVMGAPREGLLKQFVSGTIPSEVSAKAKGTVLTAHRAGVESSWLDRWV